MSCWLLVFDLTFRRRYSVLLCNLKVSTSGGIMNSYWYWLNEQNRLCELAKTSTSLETLEQLATSDDWAVRAYVQKNPHSTEDVLLLLYASKKFRKLMK